MSKQLCDLVFLNELIISNIVPHLTFESVKVCRALNKAWHKACLKSFHNRAAISINTRQQFAEYYEAFKQDNFGKSHTEYRFGPLLSLSSSSPIRSGGRENCDAETRNIFPRGEQLDEAELVEFFNHFGPQMKTLEASLVWGTTQEMDQLEKIMRTISPNVEEMRLRIFKVSGSSSYFPSNRNLELTRVQRLSIRFSSSVPWGLSDFRDNLFAIFPFLEYLAILPFNHVEGEGQGMAEDDGIPSLNRLLSILLYSPHLSIQHGDMIGYQGNISGLKFMPTNTAQLDLLTKLRNPLQRLELLDCKTLIQDDFREMDTALMRVLQCHSDSLRYLKMPVGMDFVENLYNFPQLEKVENLCLKFLTRDETRNETHSSVGIQFLAKFPKLETLKLMDDYGGALVERFVMSSNGTPTLRHLCIVNVGNRIEDNNGGNRIENILLRVGSIFPNIRNPVMFP